MITDRLDPPGILKTPEIVNASVATGSRIIHISGQTAVDAEGKAVGTTHLEQGRKALENLILLSLQAGQARAALAMDTTDPSPPGAHSRTCRTPTCQQDSRELLA